MGSFPSRFAIALVALYLVGKTYARYWIVKPTPERPGATRQNEVLRLIDFVALLAIVGAFFLFLILGRIKLSVALIVAAILYETAIRYVFVQWEIGLLRRRSPKLSRSEAKIRVRRRARATSFR